MASFSKNTKSGITFVEMLVVVGITSLVMVALVASVLYFYRSNSYVMEQAYAISEGRQGIENMVRDIREAVYSETGDYPVEKVDHNEIVFYGDIDTDSEVEKARYFVDDKKLKKGVIEPGGTPYGYSSSQEDISVVSEDVRNVENGVKTFVYYDKKGDKMAESDFDKVTDVAFVRVNLVINVDPRDKPRKFTLRSSAALRNVE